MVLECISNRSSNLSPVDADHVSQSVHGDQVRLTIGRKYTVYGIVFRGGHPWYLICENDDSEYPIPQFAGFFKTLDSRIPAGWVFRWRSGNWPDGALLPTKLSEPSFFEPLIDGSDMHVAAFRAIRAEIDSLSRLGPE
jgi:hypothetical protein